MMIETGPIEPMTLSSLLARRRQIRARLYGKLPLLSGAPLPPAQKIKNRHNPTQIPISAGSPESNTAPTTGQADGAIAAARPITIHRIARETAAFFLITPAAIASHDRRRKYSRPRQIAFYLAKTLTTQSYPAIGRRLGGFDHTTVLHGCRTIARLLKTCPKTQADVLALTRRLCQAAPSNHQEPGKCTLPESTMPHQPEDHHHVR